MSDKTDMNFREVKAKLTGELEKFKNAGELDGRDIFEELGDVIYDVFGNTISIEEN